MSIEGCISNDMRENTVCSEAITALKGIGSFIIAFFWHYHCFFSPNRLPFIDIRYVRTIVLPLYDYGYLFVELFFMLSGFGMMRGYSERIKNGKLGFINYIFKRIKKIYPLHFITLVYVVVLELVYYSTHNTYWIYFDINLKSIALNLFLLQDGYFNNSYFKIGTHINGPAWTISEIFLLYCIFYVVRKCMKNNGHFWGTMVSLSIVYLPAILFQINLPIYNVNIGRGIICFAIGCIIEWLYSNNLLSTQNLRGGGGISLSVCIVFYIAQSVLLARVECWQLLYIFIFLPCIIICALENKFVLCILDTKAFQLLGKISMEIYLLHFPVAISLVMAFDFLNVDYDASENLFWLFYAILTIGISIFIKNIGRLLGKWIWKEKEF